MTANIKQNICPRRRQSNSSFSYISPTGTWTTRRIRTSNLHNQSSFRSALTSPFSQRGTVTQSTLTMALAFFALICVSVLGFFYLQQVFGTASHGSDVQALESQMDELRERQRELELEGAGLRSLQAVEEHVQKLNLVSMGEVAYLPHQPGHVALANGL